MNSGRTFSRGMARTGGQPFPPARRDAGARGAHASVSSPIFRITVIQEGYAWIFEDTVHRDSIYVEAE